MKARFQFEDDFARSVTEMKEDTRRLLVGVSTLVSLYFVLMYTSVLITERMNVTHPLAGSGSAILSLLGSPLVFVLAVFATWLSTRLTVRRSIKLCLTVVNALGAIVAAIYTFGLVAMFRMGPINPG